jgi:hypothetical protein
MAQPTYVTRVLYGSILGSSSGDNGPTKIELQNFQASIYTSQRFETLAVTSLALVVTTLALAMTTLALSMTTSALAMITHVLVVTALAQPWL